MAEYKQSGILEKLEKELIESSAKVILGKLKECDLFCGKYDAKNGNEKFMYGISAVMEVIAHYAGDEEFEGMFLKNMIKSEEKCNDIFFS